MILVTGAAGYIGSHICEKLKSEGAKDRITLNSVLKANPKLNPRSIQIGQNLFIPDPR